ncbi:MAG: hypothetical protein ABR568_23610, partial [Pyrinomonadaceae bacterium]
LVHPVDEVTCLLELDGEEESGGYIYALVFNAVRIGAALRNLISPESKSQVICRAIEEVEIVLADEEISTVNWVGASGGRERLPRRVSLVTARICQLRQAAAI